MQTSALAYFVFALGWSSLFWAASVRWNPADDPASSFLFLLGSAGPFIAAVSLTRYG